jgi:glutamyl-tRNA synthetase
LAWLSARAAQGRIVLRIEDIDSPRVKAAAKQQAIDDLRWLGLDWDEGPHLQSRNLPQHKQAAARLLAEGKAYACFCTPEEIQAQREEATLAHRAFKYDRRCLRLSADERAARRAAGEAACARFLVPEGETRFDDAVHGETRFANGEIEDFVLLRSDGTPTYHLSVVSDDIEMRITHVIRGDDHLSNTPKQVLLYRALGCEPPRFAHLPLILGEDKKRLSKRHGAVSVTEYRDQGYLPQAMFNFLALLGWSPGGDEEILPAAELVRRFTLEAIGKRGAVFDHDKLDWMNGQYVSQLSAAEILPTVRAELAARGIREGRLADEEWASRLVDLLKSRARRVPEIAEMAIPFLTEEFPYEADAMEKHLKGDDLPARLAALATAFRDLPDFRPETTEGALRGVAASLGVAAGKLIHPCRVAVTGRGVSPGIFEVLELMGKAETLARLGRLERHLGARAAS